MNNRPIFITACSVISNDGMDTVTTSRPWEPGQKGPEDIRRPQVLSAPYMAFGKLNLPDKLAFSAASLALRECSISDPDTTGIFLGIPNGSCSTDELYRQSIEEGAPSPALFSATLPSSPVTDIAIYYRFKGPDMVFPGGTSPLLSALESAQMALQRNTTGEALVILVEEAAVTPAKTQQPDLFAAALCFTSEPPEALSAPSFHYIPDEDYTDEPEPAGYDRQLIKTLLKKIRNKESGQLGVPVSGFKGYISLRYL